ncbi:unnamed protein product [Cyprideis torosa]|uniref:Uncharacterized protein n=1 Tax=Cyprideis torosa TaxID=163714 RepID=A0A7R8WCL4_9CRUS|nr:unnamed protein product [Cyprideis torosa]CAG0888093.1 unnamed protein product [Cyprideis torosa]
MTVTHRFHGAVVMNVLEDLVAELATHDTKKKLQVGNDVLVFLKDPSNPLECEDISALVDGVVSWLNSSNFKISQYGLEILVELVSRMKENFRPYLQSSVPLIVDRLGDAKESVRQAAQSLILELMNNVASPQVILERILSGFSHKNAKVREECLIVLQKTLATHGSGQISLSPLTPVVAKLYTDPTAPVREAAAMTLVEIFRHVGERFRADLHRKGNLPPQKIQSLDQKFDEVKMRGDMMPTASLVPAGQGGDDESDRGSTRSGTNSSKRMRPPLSSKRTAGVGASGASSIPSLSSFSSSSSKKGSSALAAGAIDEEVFIAAFEDVDRIQVYTQRDRDVLTSNICSTIGDTDKDWTKRVEMLKSIRSLLIHGNCSDDFWINFLRSLEVPMQSAIRDLRSQVVREACITAAFMAQAMGRTAERLLEVLLPAVINLIQNSAKVMSSCGLVTIRFITKHIQSSRMIPIISSHLMTSKSKEIRRAMCEILSQVMDSWSSAPLEKHMALLTDAIRKGLQDADPEARNHSRRIFRFFDSKFPEQATSLFNSLDTSQKRLLRGAGSHGGSLTSSMENITAQMSGLSIPARRKPNHTQFSAAHSDAAGPTMSSASVGHPPSSAAAAAAHRSNSTLDLQAAQRVKARQQYAELTRARTGMTPSRTRKASESGIPTPSSALPLSRESRHRSRGGYSQSQPGSRSNSPSSRLNYLTMTPRTRSRIPRSAAHSRETSPGPRSRLPFPSGTVGVENKRTIGLVEAVRPPLNMDTTTSDVGGYHLDHSDESETSSLCSDFSYDSFAVGRRSSNELFSWVAATQRHYQDNWLKNQEEKIDVREILRGLSSSHWVERKEGLLGLTHLCQSNRMLTAAELRRVTECFGKMFADPHTKVFTLFLDTLRELILTHKDDLHDWLYVLITRLLMKMGADLLNSILVKINRLLDLISVSFPMGLQFQVVMRYLNDPTQMPNTKVKVATLNFLLMVLKDIRYSEVIYESEKPLHKLVTWSTESKMVADLAASALYAMHEANITAFEGAMRCLNSSDQNQIRLILSSPHIALSPSPLSRGRSPMSTSLHSTGPLSPQQENLNPSSIDVSPYLYSRSPSRRVPSSPGAGDGPSSLPPVSLDSPIGAGRRRSGSGIPSPITSPRAKMDRDPFASMPSPLGDRNEIDGAGGAAMEHTSGANDNDDAQTILQDILRGLDQNRMVCLQQLIRVVKNREFTSAIEASFKQLLRNLLSCLQDRNPYVRALVFIVFIELLQRDPFVPLLCSFTELLILRVLESHKDTNKDVCRRAEACGDVLATRLPADTVIRILKPLISTGEFPVNQAAIKMLTRLVQGSEASQIIEYVPMIMPGLIQAYDNEESGVRKAAVFGMVALHCCCGEEALAPHLISLNGSKRKLLNLYIKRTETQNPASGGSSPRGATPANGT